jgi:CRISPR-associated protein Cas5t
MQAVKVTLYQNMVNYRRELSFGYVQTYPLPTPSMVRGMVHHLLGLTSYTPLKISIQGTYESCVTNMQRIIKFDRDPKSRPNNPYHVTVGTSQKTATHGVMFVDQLVNVNLTLHIDFEDPDLNQRLLQAFQTHPVILGRNEDLARVVHVELASIFQEEIEDDIQIEKPIWMSKKTADALDLSGTYYRLPFCYETISSFEDKRLFKFVKAVYLNKGSVSSGMRYTDGKDWVDFLAP